MTANLTKTFCASELHSRCFIQTSKVNIEDISICNLVLGTHLFVKVSRPGDSERIFSVFEWSCHLLLSV